MMQLTQNRVAGSRIVALGMLVAALMAASLLLAAGQARAVTTFYVNSTADHSDANLALGSCDTGGTVPGAGGEPENECTLRAAMEQANYTTGADIINFAIPGSDVKTIVPNTGLPTITGPLTINGYSQPGASPNTKAVGSDAVLKIELSGANVSDGDGLQIGASNSTVKGLVINRFGYDGIYLADSTAVGTKIEGNFIGTDPSGTQDLGNDGLGVSIPFSGSNTVGGTSLAARNLISGNADGGVLVFSDNNQVRGNLIGTQRDGTGPLGNEEDGVTIYGSSSIVSGNTIAFNGIDGVAVYGDVRGNRVLSNSIYNNVEEGIDLRLSFTDSGPTANDPGDGDDGPNGLQNKPVITSAKTGDRTTTINARLNSTPNKTFAIQFFSNPSGTNEGRVFVGQRSVTTHASGDVTFAFTPKDKVGLGRTITATAISPGGNTSEFSAARTVVAR